MLPALALMDAYELGKEHARFECALDACPFPTGTSAAASYWAGHADECAKQKEQHDSKRAA